MGVILKKQYETKRLYLKILSSENALEVLDFYKRNKDFLEPFEPDRTSLFYTLAFHQAQLTYESRLINETRLLRYYLYDKSHPQHIIGTIALQQIIKKPYFSGTISYKIDQNYLRLGLATEAVSYLLKIAFYKLGLHRIEAYILPNNIPSIGLVEKLGFQYEGIARSSIMLRNNWYDQMQYAFIYNPLPPIL